MVTHKGNAEYRSVWQKMTSSKDHRYNTADPSTDHKEGASLIKYKPALLNNDKDELNQKTKAINKNLIGKKNENYT